MFAVMPRETRASFPFVAPLILLFACGGGGGSEALFEEACAVEVECAALLDVEIDEEACRTSIADHFLEAQESGCGGQNTALTKCLVADVDCDDQSHNRCAEERDTYLDCINP